MSIVVYFLSQYPEVLKRLRAEILERVGSSNRPTYDDIREMKYLRAVLNGSSNFVSTGTPRLPFDRIDAPLSSGVGDSDASLHCKCSRSISL